MLVTRRRRRRQVLRKRAGLVTTALLCGVALAACSSSQQSQDDLQAVPNLVAATPATSPPPAAAPAGDIVALPGDATATIADPATHILAVAISKPAELLLFSLTDPHATPKAVPLPGTVSHLSLAGGAVLAPVAAANQVVQVAIPAGTTTVVAVPGGPTSATSYQGQLLVTVPARHAIDVLTDGRVTRTISGAVNPDQILTAGGKVMMLDRIRSALFDVDTAGGSVGAGQRAGEGATNAAVDGYGRVLVTDTRTGELLAFAPGPVLMRQRSPVPGVPFGIAVDSRRNLAWVTATGLNQVIGYQLAGGQPVEKYRLPTVRQPNSVAVDPDSGRVFVASADGGGMQVMQP
jgi:DNA-binding beta-propeller fold protein YncE